MAVGFDGEIGESRLRGGFGVASDGGLSLVMGSVRGVVRVRLFVVVGAAVLSVGLLVGLMVGAARWWKPGRERQARKAQGRGQGAGVERRCYW